MTGGRASGASPKRPRSKPQLELGCSTVAVGLGIAGRVGASLAELIETEMRERAHRAEIVPAGAQIRRAAGLMWTLVALDAEVERETCGPRLGPHVGPRRV